MTALAIVLFIVEAIMFVWLTYRISKSTNLELKDTSVYPLIFICAWVLRISVSINVEGNTFAAALFSTIAPSMKTVALEFDTSYFQSLINYNHLLGISYILLCAICVYAFASLMICIFKIHFVNFVYRIFFKIVVKASFDKEFYVDGLFGFNNDMKIYLENLSSQEKDRTIVFIDKNKLTARGLSIKSIKTYLYKNKIPFTYISYGLNGFEKITKLNVKYNFISFIDDNDDLFDFTKAAIDFTQKHNNVSFTIMTEKNQNEFLKSAMTLSNGLVRTFDKYEINGYIFSQKHNFAKYIKKYSPEMFNDNLTIKNCDINLFVFGYGRINKQLIEKTLISNQFVYEQDKKLFSKRINTYIYDKNKNTDSLFLSSGLLNYKKEDYDPVKDEYFDLPNDYQNVNIYENQNIYEKNFVQTMLQEHINAKKKTFNFFIISLGEDFTNVTLADKLSRQLKTSASQHNFIFAYTQNDCSKLKFNDQIICFGSDEKLLCRRNLVLDGIFDSCIKRNYFYNHAKEYSEDKKEDLEKAKLEWLKLTPIKRASNLSSICGINFKLSLLGLEMGNLDINKYNEMVFGSKEKPIIQYDLSHYNICNDNKKEIRDVFAFMEHERWIAFTLSQTTLPLSKKEFLNLKCNQTSNGDKHACLCTTYGLIEYYNFMHEYNLAKNNGYGHDSADVIYYDYQLMDDLDKINNYLKPII